MPAHCGDRFALTAKTFQDNGIIHLYLKYRTGRIQGGSKTVDDACQGDQGERSAQYGLYKSSIKEFFRTVLGHFHSFIFLSARVGLPICGLKLV